MAKQGREPWKKAENKMKKNVLGCAEGHGSRFERLSQVYRCLESGSCPGVSAGALAPVMFVGAGGESEDDGGDGRVSSVELTYLRLSLLRKITTRLMARSLPPGLASYFVETLKILIHEMDLMSHLGVVSPVWEQTCLRAFSLSVPGPELDACLQSLTDALKRLVRGALRGDTGKLLSRFDSSLSVLCLQLLNEDRNGANTRPFGTTLCFLADLLEALTASSLIHAAGRCWQCQKLIQLHSSALLKTTSCSSEDFVKKRLLLLLKRAVLQKAGEEWISGELSGLKLKHSDADVTLLAQSVVTAVGANWLEGLQLDVSSFWGSGSINVDASKPDDVGLRAVSLILLKSMEIHIETASRRGEKGLVDITELRGYLQKLWGFLKRHSVQLREERHLCCWISLLFGEQDDDMMEAAKALLSIFLHYRQRSEVNGLALLEDACASGYNPHCLFILLLESISFDHSFLLDLLISAETCFLEYFVQYLKCLLADWQGFAVTCGRTFTAAPHSKTPPASLGSGHPSLACKGEVATCNPAHPPGDYSPLERTSSAPGLHLVNYSSSDESDLENGAPPDEKQTNRIGALDINQGPVRRTHSAGAPSQLLESPEKTSDVTCETSTRVFSCLSELQEVLMRLHMKKLFPYNPAPLLKLLKQVQDSSYSHELRLRGTNLSNFT